MDSKTEVSASAAILIIFCVQLAIVFKDYHDSRRRNIETKKSLCSVFVFYVEEIVGVCLLAFRWLLW